MDHILRPALPWRAATLTECGIPASKHSTISRDEMATLVRREGQRRASLISCMTCWEASTRWETWEKDPGQVMARELRTHLPWSPNTQIVDELRAAAALIATHREEFDAYLTGLAATVSLDERRRTRPPRQRKNT